MSSEASSVEGGDHRGDTLESSDADRYSTGDSETDDEEVGLAKHSCNNQDHAQVQHLVFFQIFLFINLSLYTFGDFTHDDSRVKTAASLPKERFSAQFEKQNNWCFESRFAGMPSMNHFLIVS